MKSKSLSKNVIAKNEERQYKLNRLNFDGNNINLSKINE